MDDVQRQLLWESIRFHALWIIPLTVGVAAIVWCIRVNRDITVSELAYTCFRFSVALSIVGATFSYLATRLLRLQVERVGDVSQEMFVRGWNRTWLPLGLSLASCLCLVVLVQRARRKATPHS